MKNISIILGITGLLALSFISCEKEYDTPPVATIPEGNIITIADLKAMHQGVPLSITEDYSIYGVLTTDETSGNFYKEAYFQDASGAINLRFTSSASTRIGDSIRLALKGSVITIYAGNFQLDSLDPDRNVIIQENNVAIAPLVLSIAQASTGTAKLVRIDNVEFACADLNKTWADAVGQTSKTMVVRDCNGNTLDVRTSGYANFAGDVVPQGKGSIIGIMGAFNGSPQFIIRNPNELTMDDEANRCTPCSAPTCNPNASLSESFLNHITNNSVSGFCWAVSSTSGAPSWLIGDLSGDKLAIASLGGTSISGSQSLWMMTPEITYASSNTLSFRSAVQSWTHDGLEVFILTNYTGDPNTATQTPVTGATIAGATSGSNVLIASGNIALSGFGISGNYRIGFKYTGNPSASQTCTYKIDDVVITQ